MYNGYKDHFSHLSIAICSTGKNKACWQKNATLAVIFCEMPLQEFFEKGIKKKSLLLVFSCLPSIHIQDQNVLIPVLKNTFMLCYFSYLLTSTCFGYLLHNNLGNRNWVVLSMPRLIYINSAVFT